MHQNALTTAISTALYADSRAPLVYRAAAEIGLWTEWGWLS